MLNSELKIITDTKVGEAIQTILDGEQPRFSLQFVM